MARYFVHDTRIPGPGDKLNCGSGPDIDNLTAAGTYLLVLQSARYQSPDDNCFLCAKSAIGSGWEILASGSIPDGSVTHGYPRVLIWTSGNRYDVQTAAGDQMQVGVQELVGFQHDGAGGITIYRGPIQNTVAASTGLYTASAGSGTIADDSANDLLIGNMGRSDQPFTGDIGWTCIYARATPFTITEVNTIRAAMVQAVGGDVAGGVAAMKTVSGYKRLIYIQNDSVVSASTVLDYSPAGSPTNLGTGLTGTQPGTDYQPVGPAATAALVSAPSGTSTSGSTFYPPPVVEIQDANGLRTSSTLAVTASVRAGNGTLIGTTTVNAVNGRATFSDLGIDDAVDGGVNEVQFVVATLPGYVSFSTTVDTSQITAPATFGTSRDSGDFGGTDRICNSSTDLTAALAACVDGDKILLAPGASFTGSFTLRDRGTTGWVEIRTNIPIATLDASCPQGTRMTPATANALNLAIVAADSNAGAFVSAYGARGYRLTGLIVQDANVDCSALIRFGDPTMTDDSQICSYMIADRLYIRNSGDKNIRRGVYASCKNWAVLDSYIENMVDGNSDSQAILCLGCAGPSVIRNNYLEGWSETVMYGGGNSGLSASNLNSVPSDAIVEQNFLTRNTAHKGTGTPYTIQKNGIEFKDCRRAIVRYNVVEKTWAEGQVGMACSIKSDPQVDTGRPLAGSQDIEVYGNWFRDAGSGYQLLANGDNRADVNLCHRIKIHNNLLERINMGAFTGIARPVSLFGTLADIYFDHNTIVKLQPGSDQPGIQLDAYAVSTNVVFRSNILQNGTYGAKADNIPAGQAIPTCLNPTTWSNNLVVGGDAAYWPATTLDTASDSTVGFTDLTGGGAGYKLAPTSPFKGAGHDGADIGIADVDAFFANLTTALTGTGSSTAPASPVASSLEVLVQPAGFVSGVAGTTQPQVRVRDQFGAIFTGAVTITATIATGAGTITGGSSATTSGGTAAFSGLTAASNFTTPLAFTFSALGVQSVTSNTITLTVPDVVAPSEDPVLTLTFDWGIGDPSLRMESIARGRAVGAARTLIPPLKDAPAGAVLDAAMAELIYSASIPRHGTTAQRPAAADVPRTMYFDDTLGKPVWSDGNAWRDATGALV